MKTKFWTIFFGVIASAFLLLCVYTAVFTNGFGNFNKGEMAQVNQKPSGGGQTSNGTTPDNGNDNGTTPDVGNNDADNGTADNGTDTPIDNNTPTDYKAQLENVYRQSLYSLDDGTRNISASLGKLAVSNNVSMASKLLIDLSGYSFACSADLAVLPDDDANTNLQALQLTNQLADYCNCLADGIADGKALTTADRNNLLTLKGEIETLNKAVSKTLEEGKFTLIWENKEDNVSQILPDKKDDNEQNAVFNIPSLIYDGAYSSSTTNKQITIKETLSDEQVLAKVTEQLSPLGFSDFVLGSAIQTDFCAYNVSAASPNGAYNIVALCDGRIAQINGYQDANGNEKPLTMTKYRDQAEEFCRQLGYDVKAVWNSDVAGNTVYVCLVYVDDEVKFYPDMVKVSFNATTNTVTGFDATAYLSNHDNRRVPAKFDSFAKAQRNVSSLLTVKEVNRALIPTECGKEYFCYEIVCNNNGEEYIVYIDKSNFTERDILIAQDSAYGAYVM